VSVFFHFFAFLFVSHNAHIPGTARTRLSLRYATVIATVAIATTHTTTTTTTAARRQR
jgi:hypothetical protein